MCWIYDTYIYMSNMCYIFVIYLDISIYMIYVIHLCSIVSIYKYILCMSIICIYIYMYIHICRYIYIYMYVWGPVKTHYIWVVAIVMVIVFGGGPYRFPGFVKSSIFEIQYEDKIIQNPFQNRLGNPNIIFFARRNTVKTKFAQHILIHLFIHFSFMYLLLSCIYIYMHRNVIKIYADIADAASPISRLHQLQSALPNASKKGFWKMIFSMAIWCLHVKFPGCHLPKPLVWVSYGLCLAFCMPKGIRKTTSAKNMVSKTI